MHMEEADPFCLRNRVRESVICVAPHHGFPAAEVQLAESTSPGVLHCRNHLIPYHIAPAGVGDMTATAGKIAAVRQRNAVDERCWALQDNKTPDERGIESNPVPEGSLKPVETFSRLAFIQACWPLGLRHSSGQNPIVASK